jgi:hypothetical protein
LHEDFMGVAAAGQRIELPGISILHFRGGQCFERWACSDSIILLNQIGASFLPRRDREFRKNRTSPFEGSILQDKLRTGSTGLSGRA